MLDGAALTLDGHQLVNLRIFWSVAREDARPTARAEAARRDRTVIGEHMRRTAGRDLLLKIDADGTAAFQTVAGLRSNAISFNAETVDVTHQDSAGQWRELLAGAGLRSAAIRGCGIFKDAASDATMRDCFFTGAIRTWQVIMPDFGVIAGPFQIASLEFGGQHDGEVTFELALELAGQLAFTEA